MDALVIDMTDESESEVDAKIKAKTQSITQTLKARSKLLQPRRRRRKIVYNRDIRRGEGRNREEINLKP